MVKENLVFCSQESIKNAVYQKAGEDEEENSAVDAAHKLVRSGEWILQEHSSRNIRKNRSQIHKEKPFREKSLEGCIQVSISEISGRTSRDAEKADQKINTEAED